MATLLTTLPDSAITMRYREPYLSKSLNAKLQTLLSAGVYSGLELSPSATALRVLVSPGVASVPSSADSTAQITIQLTGNYELDLISFPANAEVAICIEASYLLNTATTAVVNGYNLASETPPSTACVLGVVTRPATGIVVPAASITPTLRTLPWETRATATVPRTSVLRNSNFALTPAGGALPEFWFVGLIGVGSFASENSVGPSNYGSVIVASATAVAPTPQTAMIFQTVGQLLNPSRDRVGVTVSYMALKTPASGSPAIKLSFRNPSTNGGFYTAVVPLPATASSPAAYTTYALVLDLANLAPSALPARGLILDTVEISLNGATYSSTGQVFKVADLDVTIESRSNAADVQHDNAGLVRSVGLRLIDVGYMGATGATALLTYSVGLNTVTLSGTSNPNLDLPANLTVAGTTLLTGALTVGGGVKTNSIDSLTGWPLTIGGVTQTALSLGRAGAPTTVTGSTISLAGATTVTGQFNVTNASTFSVSATGAVTAAGDLTVGASKFTVLAASGNTNVAGTLNSVGNFTVGVVGTPKFTVTAASGNTVIGGTLQVTSTTNSGGDFTVGSGGAKFTVAAATGNTTALGDFTVGASKFTVAASTGNTTALGDFTVGASKFVVTASSGATAVSGALTVSNTGYFGLAATAGTILRVQNTSASYQAGSTLQTWEAYTNWAPVGQKTVAKIDSFGTMYAVAFDEIAAYPLEIGGTNATELILAKTTTNTKVLGTLTVPTGSSTGGAIYSHGGGSFWIGSNGSGDTVSFVGSIGVQKRAVISNTDQSGSVVLSVNSHPSQTADLQRWNTSSSTKLSLVDYRGLFRHTSTRNGTVYDVAVCRGDILSVECADNISISYGFADYPTNTWSWNAKNGIQLTTDSKSFTNFYPEALYELSVSVLGYISTAPSGATRIQMKLLRTSGVLDGTLLVYTPNPLEVPTGNDWVVNEQFNVTFPPMIFKVSQTITSVGLQFAHNALLGGTGTIYVTSLTVTIRHIYDT